MGPSVDSDPVSIHDWSMVAAISFDLDDTLVQYEQTAGEVLAHSFQRAGVEPFFEVQEYYDRFEDHTDGAETIGEIRSACFAEIARQHGRDPAVGRQIATAYATERDQSNVELLPGVRDVLETCKQRWKLAIITNGPEQSQAQKIGAVNLEEWIDVIIYAGEAFPPKPDTEPFHAAYEQLGVDPSGAMHVGDSITADVLGARNVGAQSVWVGTEPSEDGVTPDYSIPAPTDLLTLPPLQ